MRKVLAGAAIIILLACGLWVGNHRPKRVKSADSVSSRTTTHGTEPIEGSEIQSPLRTKLGNREAAGPRATHAPERLKEFMLPEVAIDGLTLGEALRKLMGVYDDACKKTEETPLRLTFDVPPGTTKKLHLRLSPRNFNASVHLLAAYSGMSVSRDKLRYQFEPLADERKQVTRALQVPPDFSSTIAGLETDVDPFAENEPRRMPIAEVIKASGLSLHPSTQLSLTSSGTLNINTSSSADLAMISALVDTSAEKPLQHKFTPMVIDLAADADWTPPDTSQMTDPELQLLMRRLAEKQGTTLRTLPSMASRGGQSGTIEIVREWIVPKDDSGEAFETHNVGQVMQLQGSALGFGHDVAFNFTDTTAEVDPETGKPNFNKHIDVKDSGFSSDNGTRFVVQTRPDGSRAVVLVTSTMIDATGRPIHGAE